MRRKSIITFLILLILCSFTVNAVEAEYSEPLYMSMQTLCKYSETDMPSTESGSIAVYNKESCLMIYEKNADKTVSPTSTVKIMTAIIAYESIPDLSTEITITRNVVNESTGTKLGLKIGDVYTAQDLIRAVLICGSNDAANQLAEYVSGGNKEQFIKMMNEKAVDLGCTSTNFTNVTGLHDPEMYTTASDMIKIAIYAYNLGEIANWSSLASYSFAPVNNPDNYIYKHNRNSFVSRSTTSKYYYKNSFGLSSGGTPQAGNCLVTAASRNETTYICVIMDSPIKKDDNTNYTYLDAKVLLDACFDSFGITSIVGTDSIVHEVPLQLCADADHISLYPNDSISFLLPYDIKMYDDISLEKIVYDDTYYAPIKSGDEFGELIVRYKGDYVLGRTKLICSENYERSTLLYLISTVKNFVKSSFFIASVVAAVILFGIYTIISLKNRNRFFERRR